MGNVIEFPLKSRIQRVSHVRLGKSAASRGVRKSVPFPDLFPSQSASPVAPLSLDPETEVLLYKCAIGTGAPDMYLEQRADGTLMLMDNDTEVARLMARHPALIDVVVLETDD